MKDSRSFKSALITGIGGSGGSYLADYIAEHQPQVDLHGLARWHTNAVNNLSGAGKKAIVHECDLMDMGALVRVLEKVRPDVIFHLASHANVRAGFDIPAAVLQNNIMGTVNLFEAIRITGGQPIVQLCSTSEVYGQVAPENVPINETCPLNPVSPYAVSKTTQDLLGFSYFKSYGLQIIRTRMFAYLNPRRADLFASSFARQVARIEAGLQDVLKHGNLDSTRTLIDVRDAMEAYWFAVQYGEPGEAYNIGGNTVLTVREFLDKLIELSERPISTRVDPALLRPVDVTLQIPNIEKFQKATGWSPSYSFSESLQHLIEYWRTEVSTPLQQLG